MKHFALTLTRPVQMKHFALMLTALLLVSSLAATAGDHSTTTLVRSINISKATLFSWWTVTIGGALGASCGWESIGSW